MLLSWLGVELRIPIFVLAVVAILLVLVGTMLYKILAWFIRLPFRMSRKIAERRKARGANEFIALASAVAGENVAEAMRHLRKAKGIQSDDPLFWWYAAQAYGLAGEHLEESKAYGKLMEYVPFLALRGQTQAALRRNDRQSALECLEKARDIDPYSSWCLRNLLSLYRSFKRYEEAEQVINKLEDLKYISASQAKTQLAALYQMMADDDQLSAQAQEEALRKAHFLDPGLKHVSEKYATLMFSQGHETNARKALEATWKVAPDQDIADLYIKLSAPETPLDAYELAKVLVKGTVSQPQSQLLLSRYALDAKLWGEARKILMKLEKKAPSREVYKMLALLEMQEHNNVKYSHEWAMKGYEV